MFSEGGQQRNQPMNQPTNQRNKEKKKFLTAFESILTEQIASYNREADEELLEVED